MLTVSSSRPGRLRRWLRRGVGLGIAGVLLGLIAAQVAYLTRPWWTPLALERIAEFLARELGAEVSIGALGGNWLDGIVLRDVTVIAHDSRSVLQRADVDELAIGFDLLMLARGELAGGTALRMHVRAADLQIPPAAADGAPETGESGGLPGTGDVAPWLRIAPGGASITIDRLRVTAPGGSVPLVEGPATVRVAGLPSRLVYVTAPRIEIEADSRPDGSGARLTAQLADAPSALAAFGVSLPIDEGQITLDADVTLDPPRAEGKARWIGGSLLQQNVKFSELAFSLTPSLLHVDGDIHVPGIEAEVSDFDLPLPIDPSTWSGTRGEVVAEITDLQPWLPILPAEVADWMPITGQLRAFLDGRQLRVARSRVELPGVRIEVLEGRLPLRSGDGEGMLMLDAEVSEPRTLQLIADQPPFVLQGRTVVSVRGSLERVTASARVEFGPGSAVGFAWRRLDARADYADGVVNATSVVVESARPTGVEAPAGAGFEGHARLTLPRSADESLRLTAVGIARGKLGPWLRGLGIAPPPSMLTWSSMVADLDASLIFDGGHLPSGDVSARISELTARPDRQPSQFVLRVGCDEPGRSTDPDWQSFAVTLDGLLDPWLLRAVHLGEIVDPLATPTTVHISAGGQWNGEDLPRVDAIVALPHVALPDAPPSSLQVIARMTGGVLEVDQLAVHGAFEAEAHGSFGLAEDAIFAGSVVAKIPDLGVLAPIFHGMPAGASIDLQAEVSGDASRPNGTLQLVVHAPDGIQMLAPGWPHDVAIPPPGALTIDGRVIVEQGAIRADRLVARVGEAGNRLELTAAGRTPLRFSGGKLSTIAVTDPIAGTAVIELQGQNETRVQASSTFRWSDSGIRFEDVAIESGPMITHGEGELRLDAVALCRGDVLDAELRGKLDLEHIDLGSLPPQLHGLPILNGIVSGHLVLAGTLGAPLATGEVDLVDASVKVAREVPTLDEVRAHLVFDQREIRITALDGGLGIGTIHAAGRIAAADDTTLVTAPERAVIEVELKADDALLVRSSGMKLRADADVRITGTPEALLIRGEVTINSGKIVRRVSLVPDMSNRGGGVSAGSGVSLFEIPKPIGDRMTFDLAVRTAEPVEVVTYVFDAPFRAALRLTGSGYRPQLEGAVSCTEGLLRLPAISLRVDQGLLTFQPESSTRPTITAHASARRYNIDLTATVNGPIDSADILLTSVPPLPQTDLYTLVSTGVLPAQLQREGLTGRMTMIGSYVANEIAAFYLGGDSTETSASVVDRFAIHSGEEVSNTGIESLVVEFSVTDQWMLQGERDVYEDYNMGVLYRVRF